MLPTMATQSGFPYHNLIPPLRGLPLSATQGHAEQLCGFEPCEPSPVPSVMLLEESVLAT
jgi:hypothetical protein